MGTSYYLLCRTCGNALTQVDRFVPNWQFEDVKELLAYHAGNPGITMETILDGIIHGLFRALLAHEGHEIIILDGNDPRVDEIWDTCWDGALERGEAALAKVQKQFYARREPNPARDEWLRKRIERDLGGPKGSDGTTREDC